MAELPSDYEEDCFKEGAITRRRGVSNPADLMMLAIFHLQNGCTLLEISEVARITKLGEMSDVAFMKRIEKCGNWFRSINKKIAVHDLINYQKPSWLDEKTVIAVDASDVTEKGRSGRTYRLHFALDIFNMGSVDHSITDVKVGESLVNFNLKVPSRFLRKIDFAAWQPAISQPGFLIQILLCCNFQGVSYSYTALRPIGFR